jgi:hypothetical protein
MFAWSLSTLVLIMHEHVVSIQHEAMQPSGHGIDWYLTGTRWYIWPDNGTLHANFQVIISRTKASHRKIAVLTTCSYSQPAASNWRGSFSTLVIGKISYEFGFVSPNSRCCSFNLETLT